MATILLAIGGYFVSGCWWLLMVIILMVTILMTIGEYSIGGY